MPVIIQRTKVYPTRLPRSVWCEVEHDQCNGTTGNFGRTSNECQCVCHDPPAPSR